jgi:tripartite-type tricarboxylate transporter receptor subunit TctC
LILLDRRKLILGAAAAAALARKAAAQSWPSGTIRLVVPFPPGGSVDAIARLIQPGLQQRLNATVIVENKPGASGSLGAAQVARSAPDGNSWLFVFDTHAINPSLLPNLGYDTEKDLDPILLIGTAPNVLATHPSRPYHNLSDVIAAAKAKPGIMSYGTIGAGSLGHLTMVLLGRRAGADLIHVPYRGGGPAIADAIAGHVDLVIGSAALIHPQMRAGTLRPIVQTGARRLPGLADVPTAIESGFEGFESYAWWGVFAPAGTPKPISERFGAELVAQLRDERIAKQLSETQQLTLILGGSEELRRFLAEQMVVWGAVVRDNNIKGEL